MNSEYLLGIDIGTSSCKTILVDQQGNIVAEAVVEYPLLVPQTGWVEQHPEEWWRAVKKSIGDLLSRISDKGNIRAIGLSGQMHGLVAMGREGEVLRPCILWNDQRSAPQCEKIYQRVGGREKLLSYTNNSMLPGYTGGKILWVRENEPQIYEKMAKIVLPKDYIRYRLTGEFATEVSDASGTGLFNVEKRCWSDELLSILEIPKEWLPRCYESSEITGVLSQAVADGLGLPQRIPVVGGGGDAVIQSIGAGVVSEDIATIVIGTAGIVSVPLPHYCDNPQGKLQFFCNAIPDRWIAMGVTLTAGSALRWFRDTLGSLEVALSKELREDAYEILSQEAKSSPPGAGGLIFLPYLAGERCPHTDPEARGMIIGLGLHSTKSDITRSVYEGVVYSLRDVLEWMNRVGISPAEIRASGGGAKSPFWRQIQADVFNKEVTTVRYSEEGAALAAAIIAGVGVGVWSSVEEAISLFNIETRTHPIPGNVKVYNRMFALYKKLYGQLKPIFKELKNS